MNLLVTISEEDQEASFDVARTIGLIRVSREGGLPSPVPDLVARWAGRLWEHAEHALRETYVRGRAAAQSAIDAVGRQIEAAAAELGERMVEVERIIRERLDAYFQALVDAAMGRLRSSVRIGTVELLASGASIQQTIRFSGSLKAKLDEICEFVAESELEVTVSYGSGER
jgi:hypothetical protein